MRFTNLQALRILGAVIVALCHINSYANHSLGVEFAPLAWVYDCLGCVAIAVFFSMSGFVLVHSLERVTAGEFILSRLLRIFPAYWVAVILVALLDHRSGFAWLAQPKVWAGLLLAPMGPGRAAYRLGIEWTLVFELFFYLGLGVMVLVNRRRGPTIGAALWLLAIVGRIILGPAGQFQPLPDWSEIALSPLNAPILCGVLAIHLRPYQRALRLLAPIAIPTLFMMARIIPRWDLSVLVVGCGSALLVVWAATIRQLDESHPMVVYGNWSYGVYLLHVPIISAIFDAAVRNHWTASPGDIAAAAGCAALVVGLAYGYCESSVYRRLRRRLVKPRTSEPAILKMPPAVEARAA